MNRFRKTVSIRGVIQRDDTTYRSPCVHDTQSVGPRRRVKTAADRPTDTGELSGRTLLNEPS